MEAETTDTKASSLSELLEVTQDALEEAKKAYKEADSWREQVVELEKIARETKKALESAPKTPEDSLVDETVSLLVENSFLDEEFSEKLASELKSDPSTALRLVKRFIEISPSNFAFSEGQGVPKSASEMNSDSSDPDGWLRVVKEGA